MLPRRSRNRRTSAIDLRRRNSQPPRRRDAVLTHGSVRYLSRVDRDCALSSRKATSSGAQHRCETRGRRFMKVRFWGTRGSIATPGPETVHFGGNTSCVEVTTASGNRLILDCGTGARALAVELTAQGKKASNSNILFGHTHWDHIQGFPFFSPAFVKGNSVAIYGPEGSRVPLRDVLAGQMEFTYFPVDLNELPAAITYHELTEGIHTIGGARVPSRATSSPSCTRET